MSLPRYPEYKDSGIHRLGEVPSHWKVVSLRYLTECLDGIRVPLNSAERADRSGTVPYWGANCIMDYVDAALLDEDLVLLGEDGAPFFDRDRPVAFFSQGEVWPNNHIHVLRPKTGCLGPFLVSALNATDFASFIDGSTRDKLTQGAMNRIPVALPCVEEQSAIATFLNRETGKIDALIAEQEKLLTLLAEKRQATISHAVTRGLNPNAPMKDSGVPWLGEVPAHWGVIRLKFIASVQTGIAKGKDVAGKDTVTVPYLRVANVQDGFLKLSDVATIKVEPEQVERYRLRNGDVLMNEGGDFDKLGRGAIWHGEVEDCIHQNHVFAVRPHNVRPAWLNQVNSSEYAQFYFMGRSKQSTNLASISSTNIMELPIVFPPDEEQAEILDWVGVETERFDRLETEVNRALVLLKERRSALIAAAVTGKIDVRGEV